MMGEAAKQLEPVNVADIVTAVGWQIIVAPILIEEKTEGGIVLATEARRAKNFLRYVGEVVAMGAGTYQHPKFLGHQWCQVGDWVVYGNYAGFEMNIKLPHHPFAEDDGVVKLRVINDDQVRGIVHDKTRIQIYCD